MRRHHRHPAAAVLPAAVFLAASLLPLAAREIPGMTLAYHDVLVSAPAQNKRIVAMPADEGDVVKEGQVLAVLESTLEELEAKRFAKILEKRKFENEAATTLAKEEFISRDEALERSLELEIADIQLEASNEKLALLTVASPVAGIIVERLKDAGESVSDSQPEPLFRIVDVSRVFVQCYLTGEDVFLLEAGDRVVVTFPLLPEGTREATGTVHFVSPIIDGSSGLLRVKILVENPTGAIKAGMRAHVALPGDDTPQ